MTLGLSGEAFGNLLVLLAFMALLIVGIIFIIAHKNGIDVTRRGFQLKVGISGIMIFVIVPLCLSDISIEWKIIGSIASLGVGIGNYFAIDQMQWVLKGQFGKKKKNNRQMPHEEL
jgi:hypothetical protein